MNFRPLFSLFSNDLAIDLGTANTLVYAKGRGIVVNEPSIVAINKVTNQIEAIGKEAKDMLERTPDNIVAIRPMKDDVIADFTITEKMLTYFIHKAHGRKMLVHPQIVIGVPAGITQVEKRAVQDSTMQTKASEVHLVEQTITAAIGSKLPVTEPSKNIIVDIGSKTTEIAVISLSNIVHNQSDKIAGNEMDETITQYIKQKYNLLIDEQTTERVKMKINSAFPLEEKRTIEIKKHDLMENVPKSILISNEKIRKALDECINVLVNSIRIVLERTPPELSSDLADRGIVLAEKETLIRNLDQRIRKKTGLPIILTENPLSYMVMGTSKMLSDFVLLKKTALT